MNFTTLIDFVLSRVSEILPPLRYLDSNSLSSLRTQLVYEVPPLEAMVYGDATLKYDRKIFRRDRYGINVSLCYSSLSRSFYLSPYLGELELAEFYAYKYQSLYGRSGNKDHVIQRQISRSHVWNDLLTASIGHSDNPKKTLEIGASYGFCSNNLDKINKGAISAYVLEPSREQALMIQQEFYSLKVVDKLDSLHSQVDFLFADHVFEHITNPFDFLKDCISSLSASGIVCFALPLVEHFGEIDNKPYITNIHIAHCRYYTYKTFIFLAHHLGLVAFIYLTKAREPGECFICLVPKSNINLTNRLSSSDFFEDLGSKLLDESYYDKLPSKLRNKLFYSSLLIVLRRFLGKIKRIALR